MTTMYPICLPPNPDPPPSATAEPRRRRPRRGRHSVPGRSTRLDILVIIGAAGLAVWLGLTAPSVCPGGNPAVSRPRAADPAAKAVHRDVRSVPAAVSSPAVAASGTGR